MIKVTDKYMIKASEDCYTVYEVKISESGKEYTTNATYYGEMTSAINNILHRMQRRKLDSDEVITLKEAIEELRTAKEEFTKLIED